MSKNPLSELLKRDDCQLVDVQELIDKHPEYLQKRVNGNNLPLHYALLYKSSFDVVQLILSAYPDGAKQIIKSNDLPLHAAIKFELSDEILLCLIHHYPKGARGKDTLDKYFIHQRSQLIPSILSDDMPLLLDGSPRDHSYSWNALVDCQYCDLSMTIDIVTNILEEYKSHAKRLVYCLDEGGRSAYNVAHPRIQELMNKYILFCGRFEVYNAYPLHISATSAVLQANDHSIQTLYEETFIKHMDRDNKLSMKSFDNAINSVEQYLDVKLNDLIDHKNKRDVTKSFLSVDTNNTGLLDKIQFKEYCTTKFGKTRQVILKLMKNEEQYEREKQTRDNFNSDAKIASVRPLELLPEPDQDIFREHLPSLVVPGVKSASLMDYKYCLVMPYADRNLDAIQRHEQQGLLTKLEYFENIIDSVLYLHDNDVMHGDIKPLNVVRYNNHMRLIDLDAAVTIHKRNYAGSKFSSGVLPPEMFVELSEEGRVKHEHYWKANPDRAKMWDKVKPFIDGIDKKIFAVRSYAVDRACRPMDIDQLPYDLVPASPEIDAWSLGVMLYTLTSRNGNTLFKVDNNDDLDDQDMNKILNWTDNDYMKSIDRTVEASMRPLVKGLLTCDPNKRMSIQDAKDMITKMKSALNVNEDTVAILKDIKDSVVTIHKDVNLGFTYVSSLLNDQMVIVNEMTRRVMNLNSEISEKLAKSHKEMMRGIIEANDVDAPSCFVVVNQRLNVDKSNMTKDNIKSRTETAVKWMKTVFDIVNDPSSIKDLFHGSSLYLYLIDEFTMEPVVSGDYPIEIQTPAEFVSNYLPLMKVAWGAIRLCNMAAGLSHCFGFPLPTIPDQYISDANSFLDSFRSENSAASYDVVNNAKNSGSQASVMRGEQLRRFKMFLLENDPRCNFSGLRRLLTDSGHCVWTSDSHILEIDPHAIVSGNMTTNVKDNLSPASNESSRKETLQYANGSLNVPDSMGRFIDRQSLHFKSWDPLYYILENGSLVYFKKQGEIDSLKHVTLTFQTDLIVELKWGTKKKLLRFKTNDLRDEWSKAFKVHQEFANN